MWGLLWKCKVKVCAECPLLCPLYTCNSPLTLLHSTALHCSFTTCCNVKTVIVVHQGSAVHCSIMHCSIMHFITRQGTLLMVVHWVLYTVHCCKSCSVHCTVQCCTAFTVFCTLLYTVLHSILYIWHCCTLLYTGYCTMYIMVNIALYSVLFFTQCTVHWCTSCKVHCTHKVSP